MFVHLCDCTCVYFVFVRLYECMRVSLWQTCSMRFACALPNIMKFTRKIWQNVTVTLDLPRVLSSQILVSISMLWCCCYCNERLNCFCFGLMHGSFQHIYLLFASCLCLFSHTNNFVNFPYEMLLIFDWISLPHFIFNFIDKIVQFHAFLLSSLIRKLNDSLVTHRKGNSCKYLNDSRSFICVPIFTFRLQIESPIQFHMNWENITFSHYSN